MISICSDGARPNSSAFVVRSPSSRFHRELGALMRNDERSRMNIAAEQAHVRKNLGEYARGAESDCAIAMAEAERVLRELSLVAHFTRQSNPGCSSTADETSMAQRLVSRQSAVPSLSPSSIDRLPLDPGLDFVVHDDGMIELTEAGFRRMWQTHSAGLD